MQEPDQQDSSQSRQKILQNGALLLSFLVLIALSLFLALESRENANRSLEWQETSKRWQKQARIFEEKLKASEEDVAKLEARQNALSSEKASAEDTSSAYKKINRKLLWVSRLQQICSNKMTLLAARISRGNFAWARKNQNAAITACNRAARGFQSIGEE